MDCSKFTYYYFIKVEAYKADSHCYAFRRGTDVKNGITLSLGNMVSGYPFEMEGVEWQNSECAYIAGAFSLDTPKHRAIRRQLAQCSNGLMAKRAIRRPNEHLKRSDWEAFNIQWMLRTVWAKCQGNEDFRRLLLSIPADGIIIEDSTFQNSPTAVVWGTRNMEMKKKLVAYRKELKAQGKTKAQIKKAMDEKRLGELSDTGVFEGKNVMGKVLMCCRDNLRHGTKPLIDHALLKSKHIHLDI